MDRNRRAFALVIAMAVVTAAFAAAMSLSLLSRAAVVEAGALERGLEDELAARSAATRVVFGVVGERLDASGQIASDRGSAGAEAPEVDTDKLPEMPEFLREFLEGMLEEDEDEAPEEAPPASPTSTRNATRYLAARGLPPVPVRVEIAGRAYEVRLADAASGVNLNRASIEELESIALIAGASRAEALALAAEIIDYRDADDFLTPRGAERDAYRRRGMEIRNGPFLSIEELAYLPSMTPERLRRLRPLVTIIGNGSLHAGTAPPDVMLALPGMTEESVRRIVALREAGRLDAETLERAISGFARDLAERFRFEPSPALRVSVRRAQGVGPRFEGTAIVSADAGVQWMSFEPGAEQAWD